MIITLCGSARFEEWFHAWNEALGLAGHAAFGLSAYPSRHDGAKNWHDDAIKKTLDEVHMQKLAVSDATLVLNVFGYIGKSTMNEIEMSRKLLKPVFFLESWGAGKGISSNHTKRCRDMVEEFDLELPTVSPLDTYAPYGLCPFNHSTLLGPAGSRRRRIVELVNVFNTRT